MPELVLVAGADHCFSHHTYELVNRVVEWLHRRMDAHKV